MIIPSRKGDRRRVEKARRNSRKEQKSEGVEIV